MKTYIKMRKSAFDNLFKHILSVNFCETWAQYEISNDTSKNPLVIFETKKWGKLLKLINKFIDKNHVSYIPGKGNHDFTMDLIVGSFMSIVPRIERRI